VRALTTLVFLSPLRRHALWRKGGGGREEEEQEEEEEEEKDISFYFY